MIFGFSLKKKSLLTFTNHFLVDSFHDKTTCVYLKLAAQNRCDGPTYNHTFQGNCTEQIFVLKSFSDAGAVGETYWVHG